MTLLNALTSSQIGVAIRVFNDSFSQVVMKSGGSFFVGKGDRRVTVSPFPHDGADNWQILLPGPTYAAINSRSLEQVA